MHSQSKNYEIMKWNDYETHEIIQDFHLKLYSGKPADKERNR